MRDIKFRGQTGTTEGKKWVYGHYYKVKSFFNDKVGHFIGMIRGNHLNDFSIDENTLGQYIGLKDKKGKEIYEGDIVEILWYDRKKRYVVKYGEYKIDCCGCCYKEHNAYGFYLEHIKLRDAQLSINDDEIVEIVVIGNIYENPELLK